MTIWLTDKWRGWPAGANSGVRIDATTERLGGRVRLVKAGRRGTWFPARLVRIGHPGRRA